MSDLGELPGEALGEALGQLGLEERRERLGPIGIRVESQEDTPHFVPNGIHREASRTELRPVRRFEVRSTQRLLAFLGLFGHEEQREGIDLLGQRQPGPRRPVGFVLVGFLDHQDHVARRDLLPLLRDDLLDGAGDRRVEADLHLHGFEQAEGLPDFHRLADRDLDGHDDGGRARTHLSRHLGTEAERVTVDFETQPAIVRVVDDAPDAIVDLEPGRVIPLLAHRRADR